MKKLLMIGALVAVGGVGVGWIRSRRVPKPKPLVITMPTKRPPAAQLKYVFPDDSRTVFEQSDRFILYSIPDPLPSSSPVEGAENFHNYWGIPTEIKNKKVKAALVAHFYDGMARPVHPALCFEPHHGIRAIKGKKVLDLVICFGCSGVLVFYGGKTSETSVNQVPQGFFNAVLDDAGVPNNWTGR